MVDEARDRWVTDAHHAWAKGDKASAAIALTQTNWLTREYFGSQVEAQYRYHGPIIKGVLSKEGSGFVPESVLPEPVAPGQSLVCYRGEELLGGGIIV